MTGTSGIRWTRRARAELEQRGYDGSAHRARQIDASWLPGRDLFLAMDRRNLADLRLMAAQAGVPADRVRLFGAASGLRGPAAPVTTWTSPTPTAAGRTTSAPPSSSSRRGPGTSSPSSRSCWPATPRPEPGVPPDPVAARISGSPAPQCGICARPVPSTAPRITAPPSPTAAKSSPNSPYHLQHHQPQQPRRGRGPRPELAGRARRRPDPRGPGLGRPGPGPELAAAWPGHSRLGRRVRP